MSYIRNAISAWQRNGFAYVAKRAPYYIKKEVCRNILPILYNPYGTISREEMISICEVDDNVWYYGAAGEVEISPPMSGKPPKSFQTLIGIHEISPSFVCELQDIRLVGDRALCRTKDGQFVLEELGTPSTYKSHIVDAFGSFNTRRKLQEISTPSPYEFAEPDYDTIINLVPRHGGHHNNYANYEHWMLEDLPRLRAYDHYYNETGRKPTLLLKNDPPPWMRETLRLLGFSSADWTEWNNDIAVTSRLVVPKLSYIHSAGSELQPFDRRWVVEQMKSRIDLSAESDFPERVFVSRQGQARRRIINFDEVMGTLREFEFESVRPEEMTIKKQIRLFHHAELIVGPFGANLTNAIFLSDGKLIEIFPHSIKTLNYIIANEQGLGYDYIIGEPHKQDVPISSKESDILVDVDKLLTVLSPHI